MRGEKRKRAEKERRETGEKTNRHILALQVQPGMPEFKGYVLLSGTSQMTKDKYE